MIFNSLIEKKQFSEAKLFCDKIPASKPLREKLMNEIKALK